MDIPFSAACERNKDVILDAISPYLRNTKSVLEIGSGTAQHALHFAQNLPHLNWQTSDQCDYLAGVNAQIDNAKSNSNELVNLLSPIQLDVTQENWLAELLIDKSKEQAYGAVYTANTFHIMDWSMVRAFFTGVQQVSKQGTYLVVYGPFKYQGKFTSASNQDFDQDLQNRGVGSGIRDFEEVDKLSKSAGFVLIKDIAMPANNQCLIWQYEKS